MLVEVRLKRHEASRSHRQISSSKLGSPSKPEPAVRTVQNAARELREVSAKLSNQHPADQSGHTCGPRSKYSKTLKTSLFPTQSAAESYRRRDSNPHGMLLPPDFESGVSAIPPLRLDGRSILRFCRSATHSPCVFERHVVLVGVQAERWLFRCLLRMLALSRQRCMGNYRAAVSDESAATAVIDEARTGGSGGCYLRCGIGRSRQMRREPRRGWDFKVVIIVGEHHSLTSESKSALDNRRRWDRIAALCGVPGMVVF